MIVESLLNLENDETLGAIADQCFGNSLEGRVRLTAGLGGMDANRPRAMKMQGNLESLAPAKMVLIDCDLGVWSSLVQSLSSVDGATFRQRTVRQRWTEA